MSITTIPKPADRADWLEARRPYFNASQAGALYGVHPFCTLADVAIEKLSPAADTGPTDAMERGNRLEPVLLDWYGDRLGVRIVTPDELFTNGRLMATLDGIPVGSGDEWVEVKTTREVWDDPPMHVYWQVVAQGAATGRKRCHVVWLDGDMRLKSAIVCPEPEHVADLLARVESFMDWIDMGMLPEGLEMTAAQVAAMFPAPEQGKAVELGEDGYQAVARWEQARRLRVAAEKHEAECKDAVASLLLDAEQGTYEGLPIVTWKQSKGSVRFDAKRLEAESPQTYEAYSYVAPGPRVMRATKAVEL